MFQPIWSPIDEYNHFFYTNYLYYQHRPPVIGMMYQGTTDPHVDPALAVPPSHGRGVAMPSLNPSSEAIQPPGYYLLMVPAFVTAPHLSDDQVIHVRLATVALAAFVVPFTFALARLAAPSTPWVWAAASVLPALSRGYTFNLSQVTNDALAAFVGGAAALVLFWLLRHRLDWRWGVIAGAVTGLAAISKVTVYFVGIAFAAAFLVRLARHRNWRGALTAAAVGIVIPALVTLPWLVLNLRRYHTLVGNTAFPANLNPYHNLPLLDALRVMVQLGSIKFWVGEIGIPEPPLWLVAVGEIGLIGCAAGLITAIWSRRSFFPNQAVVIAWTAIGLGYLFVLVLSTHVAILAGRYLYPLFPALATVAALGADRLGWAGRWLFIASALALAALTVIGLQQALDWVTASCNNCALAPIHP